MGDSLALRYTLPLGTARARTRDARNPPRTMSWWARSSLRTKIFVAFSALIVAVLLATLSLTQFIVSREAQRTLSRELLDDRSGVSRVAG